MTDNTVSMALSPSSQQPPDSISRRRRHIIAAGALLGSGILLLVPGFWFLVDSQRGYVSADGSIQFYNQSMLLPAIVFIIMASTSIASGLFLLIRAVRNRLNNLHSTPAELTAPTIAYGSVNTGTPPTSPTADNKKIQKKLYVRQIIISACAISIGISLVIQGLKLTINSQQSTGVGPDGNAQYFNQPLLYPGVIFLAMGLIAFIAGSFLLIRTAVFKSRSGLMENVPNADLNEVLYSPCTDPAVGVVITTDCSDPSKKEDPVKIVE